MRYGISSFGEVAELTTHHDVSEVLLLVMANTLRGEFVLDAINMMDSEADSRTAGICRTMSTTEVTTFTSVPSLVSTFLLMGQACDEGMTLCI